MHRKISGLISSSRFPCNLVNKKCKLMKINNGLNLNLEATLRSTGVRYHTLYICLILITVSYRFITTGLSSLLWSGVGNTTAKLCHETPHPYAALRELNPTPVLFSMRTNVTTCFPLCPVSRALTAQQSPAPKDWLRPLGQLVSSTPFLDKSSYQFLNFGHQ